MNIQELKRVYFIGIGGIGMSALARYFHEKGVVVQGYDRHHTELTRRMEQEGIIIHTEDHIDLLDQDAGLIVYTPAIPAIHQQLTWYRENGYPVYKRSDVLQWITQSMFAITVAGTHGKTTTSTMAGWLLRETGYGCNAFLGGISANYNTNFWSSDTETAVIEADEYDRSFLKLNPDIAILTSMDPDHLDIYGTREEMENAFIQYTQNIKPGGILLFRHGITRSGAFRAEQKYSYSLQNDAADIYAHHIVQQEGGYRFSIFGKKGIIENIYLPVGGMHNVENAVAAIAVAMMLGIDGNRIKEALAGFRGVKRRFEYVVKTIDTIYVDDYAHHPEELAALIKSVKQLFPEKKCVIVFQPHLFSRTRDMATEFAHSLDMADEVILLDIYPARELPIGDISAQTIADRMNNPAHTILSKEGLLDYVRAARPGLLVTAGAGDIDQLVQPIKQLLEQK